MFNTTNNVTKNTLNINAVSGTILKNYRKSYFKRFHLKSDFANCLLHSNPKDGCEDVVVVQMMICGDMEVIAELIYKKDFDELFENNSEKSERTEEDE